MTPLLAIETTRIRLWFIKETEKARLYSRTPENRGVDSVWIPKSVIEHTTKRGNEHEVTLTDWIIEREGL